MTIACYLECRSLYDLIWESPFFKHIVISTSVLSIVCSGSFKGKRPNKLIRTKHPLDMLVTLSTIRPTGSMGLACLLKQHERS